MPTLPSATPAAKSALLTSLWPRSARSQASATFFRKSWPGTSGMGTWLTVRRSCVAAMATIANGSSATSRPSSRTAWVTRSNQGVRSTTAASLVVNAPLDEAELREGKDHDDEHEHDALRCRAGIIEPLEAVEIDRVDHELRGACRSALGHDVDDAERVGEAVGEIDDDQEEQRRGQQRQLDVAHAAEDAGAVHGGRLDQRPRDRLQRRQEEDEAVADVLPGEGDDDGDHRVDAVERRVPQARPEVVDEGHEARLRRQDETERHAKSRRRDGIGPYQHRAIDTIAAQL